MPAWTSSSGQSKVKDSDCGWTATQQSKSKPMKASKGGCSKGIVAALVLAGRVPSRTEAKKKSFHACVPASVAPQRHTNPQPLARHRDTPPLIHSRYTDTPNSSFRFFPIHPFHFIISYPFHSIPSSKSNKYTKSRTYNNERARGHDRSLVLVPLLMPNASRARPCRPLPTRSPARFLKDNAN